MEPGRSSQHRGPETAGEASAQPQATEAARFGSCPLTTWRDPAGTGALPNDDVPDEALIAALVAGEPEALRALTIAMPGSSSH